MTHAEWKERDYGPDACYTTIMYGRWETSIWKCSRLLENASLMSKVHQEQAWIIGGSHAGLPGAMLKKIAVELRA